MLSYQHGNFPISMAAATTQPSRTSYSIPIASNEDARASGAARQHQQVQQDDPYRMSKFIFAGGAWACLQTTGTFGACFATLGRLKAATSSETSHTNVFAAVVMGSATPSMCRHLFLQSAL
jgi:hypothetical protein